jgi:glycosyltransferase involved in cell wall biosynthesis
MKKKVCFIVSAEITVKAFLIDYIAQMRKAHDIVLIVNTKDPDSLRELSGDISVVPISIERKINIIHDLCTLCSLYAHFVRNRYDLIHSFTPKAGLLSMISAKAAGVPIRIHTFTGQVWANKRGTFRFVLKLLDRFMAFCATNILVDSLSQREFIVKEKVVPKSKTMVIANGSICGVDTERFKPDMVGRREIRKSHSIPESDIVFLFLGRLTVDKGILDLAEAFFEINRKYFNTHLMVVGPDEEGIKKRVIDICKNCSNNLHFENYTDAPEKYMAASDVFCLPSYREGFGLVIIEAASAGIPSIGSRIYGITDAIDDPDTGFLFNTGNIKDLAEAMESYIARPSLIRVMGKNAQDRAKKLFEKTMFMRSMIEYYEKTLRYDFNEQDHHER